jgi:hypothetical protein
VSTAIPTETPDRSSAASRLQRVQWFWAILLAAIGALYLTPLRNAAFSYPLLSAVPYLACGALLGSVLQPAHLALVAAIWGISAVMLVPPIVPAFGTDPLVALLGSGGMAVIIVAALRLLFMAIAWRQFLSHRSLYAGPSSLTPDTSPASVPPIVENLTDRMAEWSAMLGFFSLMAPIVAMGMRGVGGSQIVLQASLVLATFALGTGLGSFFSPTNRRSSALRGILLGGLGFLLTLAIGAAPRGIPAV